MVKAPRMGTAPHVSSDNSSVRDINCSQVDGVVQQIPNRKCVEVKLLTPCEDSNKQLMNLFHSSPNKYTPIESPVQIHDHATTRQWGDPI